MCETCHSLHQQLKRQESELYHLRNSLNAARKGERQAIRTLQNLLRKQKKQHYKNGKRGTQYNG